MKNIALLDAVPSTARQVEWRRNEIEHANKNLPQAIQYSLKCVTLRLALGETGYAALLVGGHAKQRVHSVKRQRWVERRKSGADCQRVNHEHQAVCVAKIVIRKVVAKQLRIPVKEGLRGDLPRHAAA